MESNRLPPDSPGYVDPVTLDLFSSEGAPSPVERHYEAIACPAPRNARQRTDGAAGRAHHAAHNERTTK